jgi:beta-N-acetylhexosaminidase
MGLIIGLAGTALSAQESEYVQRKQVAGVILFSRNFSSRRQITALIQSLRSLRKNLLICVDQEGGRVQRFTGEFVALPALAEIGALYRLHPGKALQACELHARAMALDMLSIGIDLSFAPVADLQRGNLAIADRALSPDPAICAELVSCYAQSMQACGMAATLKHFPGHGSVGLRSTQQSRYF